MGFGGTTVGTVSVDIVQTDVNAIVAGIAGVDMYTLSDLHWLLNAIHGDLFDYQGAVSYLSGINVGIGDLYNLLRDGFSGESAIDALRGINNDLDQIRDYLYDTYSERSLIQVMTSMESILSDIRNNTAPY